MYPKENVEKWFFMEEEESRRQKRREHKARSKNLEKMVTSKHESFKKKKEDRLKPLKSPKNNSFCLDIKPFTKTKTARESSDKLETKRYRKPSDRVRRRVSPLLKVAKDKICNFNSIWDYTNYSVVPMYSPKKNIEIEVKETKQVKTENEVRRSQKNNLDRVPKKENKKTDTKLKAETVFKKSEESLKTEILYPVVNYFVQGKQKRVDDLGGKAVVIYQRENRKKLVLPEADGDFRFEQIVFTGNSEANLEQVQSKRSLSEPRKKPPKETCLGRRRTRFHLEPNKMASSTQSDFQSSINSLKQTDSSLVFKKSEKVKTDVESRDRSEDLLKVNLRDEKKCGMQTCNAVQKQTTLAKSKSSTDSKAEVRKRLQQMAEKKLDLHREMIRAENTNKKKFWESIERSLNYRCALADMFSSQSFISQNESSKFFSSAENSGGHSTEIFVRESVIEKISSYQGFHSFMAPGFNGRHQANIRNITQTPSSAYHQMKTLLGSILINEDEEEEAILLKRNFNNCHYQSSSDSTVLRYDTPHETVASLLPSTTSERLSLLESNLASGLETNSELELLMSKLSEELKKCSRFIYRLNSTEKEKVNSQISAKNSISDSKIELDKKEEMEARKKKIIREAGRQNEYIAYPIKILPTCESVSTVEMASVVNNATVTKPSKKTSSKRSPSDEQKPKAQDSSSKKQESHKPTELQPSNTSLYSFGSRSVSLSNITKVSSVRTDRNEKSKALCCDDCKFLKKRIVKLERELEKIEKRLPFYPLEQQKSIKDCLEKLKTTSETVLKRLRSCAKLQLPDFPNSKFRKNFQKPSKRSSSAPEPVVQETSSRKVCLRSSNSDYHLNVGMEITMENVDPKTGVKLHPGIAGDDKQEGNISCRVFKDGESPVLVMDTDFCYNPKTGMLFKDSKSKTSSHVADFVVPTKKSMERTASATNLPKMSSNSLKSVKAYECSKVETNLFEEPKKKEAGSSKKVNLEVEETAKVEPKKSKTKKDSEKAKEPKEPEEPKQCEKSKQFKEISCLLAPKIEKKSRIPTRRKATPNYLMAALVLKSQKSRSFSKDRKAEKGLSYYSRFRKAKYRENSGKVTRPQFNNRPLCDLGPSPKKYDSLSSKSSLMSFAKSDKSSVQEKGNFAVHSSSKNFSKNIMKSMNLNPAVHKMMFKKLERLSKMDKSTQTYQQHPSKEFVLKKKTLDKEIQIKASTKTKKVQATSDKKSSDSGNSQSAEKVDLSEFVWDFQQLFESQGLKGDAKWLQKMSGPSTSEVGVQADDLADGRPEDRLRYLNDLRIQKKVNMAIAELCFHMMSSGQENKTNDE